MGQVLIWATDLIGATHSIGATLFWQGMLSVSFQYLLGIFRLNRSSPPLLPKETAVSSNAAPGTARKRIAVKPAPSPLWGALDVLGKVTGGAFLGTLVISSSLMAGGLVGLATSFRNLPDVRGMKGYVPTETTYIYDMKGSLLSSIHDEANRKVVPMTRISPHLKRAVIAMEDSHFYNHNGVNPISVGRAFLANFSSGGVVEGGSTLTMQLIKNLFLTPERAVSRKAAEAVLAIRLEQVLSKDEIFELYLNQVYWGHNTYGAETAAQSYFNKSAADLTLAEAAMMAGFIQAPEAYSPFDGNYNVSEEGYKLARQRQAIVLGRMRTLGWISPEEEQEAKAQPITLGKVTSFSLSKMPYVTEAVVQELTDRFGRDAVLKGGMRVQTTIDTKLQRTAEATVKDWRQRIRYGGVNADQIALVAVDPRTHFVKAMVGGVDYEENQFNRAINAYRQPGSAFKPFVYYLALANKKYTPNTPISDTSVSYPDGDGWYTPRNYDNTFSGSMSLRNALAYSRNIPAIRLGQEVGIDKVIELCRILGIESPMEPVISLPLGSTGITPLEMAGAYATFASGGWQSPTTFIAQVTDSRGRIILDNSPRPQLVLEPKAVSHLTSMMETVIQSGTGGRAAVGRPAAGKTGTTTSQRDVWFVGYVPQLAASVWIGNDNYSPLAVGSGGGSTAAPVWGDFMERALNDAPVEQFPKP
jgi:penicillin-binding protein 1A